MNFFLYIYKKLWYNISIKLKKRILNYDIAIVTGKVADGEVAIRQKQKVIGVYRYGTTQGTIVGV